MASDGGGAGESARVASLDELRARTHSNQSSVVSVECFQQDAYTTGYVRFLPGRPEGKMIQHRDLDVVCLVVGGRGRLAHGKNVVAVGPGTLCRVPAGTPHSFLAEEPLELFYSTIRVPPAATVSSGPPKERGTG